MQSFWGKMALLQSVHTGCSSHPVLINETFPCNIRFSAIHAVQDPSCLHPRRQSLNGFSRLRISKYVTGSKLERGVAAFAPEQNATASKPKRGRPRKEKRENEVMEKAHEAPNITQADSNGSVPVKKRGRKKKENPALEEFLSKSLDNLVSEKDGEDSPSNSTHAENAPSSPESATQQTQGGIDYGIKVEGQPDVVDEEDYDWPDEADAIVEDRWKVRASDYFTETLIRNVRDEDGNVIDWEGEADNYSIKEICSLEWEPLVFHPSPLIVLVFERYRRVSDNWKALKELEKAIQVYWDSKNKLPPRTVKLDAKVEKDLASALKVEETPELLFIRGSKLLYRETEIRTADELVKMIAHFYYNAKRPSWLQMAALDARKAPR